MHSLFRSKKLGGLKPSTDKHARQVPMRAPDPAATRQAADRGNTPQNHDTSHREVTRDLWKEASALLLEEEHKILWPTGTDRTPQDRKSQLVAVERVKKLTEFQYKEYCERGWHTKKGDTTRETNVKNKAQEIMCAALQFDHIVQAGLKFDPSNYGTIVWGVLSAGLRLVQNDKDRADAVFDSAAVLARYLSRYAIIEDQYRNRQTQEQKAFEDQIREVYASILRYAACVQKNLNMSPAERLLGAFWTLDNQDIKDLKDKLEDNDKTVDQQCRLVADQYRKQEFEKLDAQALETLNKVDVSVQLLLKAERDRTLEWLSDDSPLTDKQQELRTKVERINENSGEWLLNSDEYTSWRTSAHSFLWLYGTSGCGKSILCSTVVKSLTTESESSVENSNMILAYWYFNNADSQTQDLQRLVRLILRRVSYKASPLPEPVRDLAKRHEAARSAPDTRTLITTLKDTIAAVGENVFLVVDAIDEYQTGNNAPREEFLDFLVELSEAKLPNLHILVTSVSEPDIDNAFTRIQPPSEKVNVEKPVSVDVNAYLEKAVENTKRNWDPEVKTKIKNALKADGNFRIVSLQLEDLGKCYDEGEIDAALKSIPRSIEDAYLRELKSVAPKDVRRLRYIFYWVSVAARQLTTSELAAAPGVELPHPTDVFDICPSSMIRVEQQKTSGEDQMHVSQEVVASSFDIGTDLVTFDHPSVKRFLYSSTLRSRGDHVSQFYVSETDVQAKLVRLMVEHLLAIQQPNIGPSIVKTTPFLPYAGRYWHDHMKDGGIILENDEMLKFKLLTLFEEPMNPAYLNWIRTWDPERRATNFGLTEENCPSPLYMAVFLRLDAISRVLVEQGSSIQAAGAKPDKGNRRNESPLQMACFRGSKSIVELLLDSGANVNLKSGSFGTALQAAAAAGHSEIVGLLLDKGADPADVGGCLGTAIQAAETGRHSEVVKQLVARGVAWDEEGDSVWHEAYDQWSSTSSMIMVEKFIPLNEPSLGSRTQQMLAGVFKIFTTALSAESRLSTVGTKSTDEKWEAAGAKGMKLTSVILKKAQMGMGNKGYVYRAFFWAMLLQSRAEAVGLRGTRSGYGRSTALWDQEMFDGFATAVLQLASAQRTIEHGNSDDLLFARHELVKCYVLAFEVASRALQQLQKRQTNRWLKATITATRDSESLKEFHRQYERFESAMSIARVQELSSADAASEMQQELLKKTRSEIREGFQTLDEGMQKRMADLEHRVVESIRDILPGIIREEMRKLLDERKDNTDR